MRTAFVVGAILLAGLGSARGDSISVNFDAGYAPGSIDGQNGWGGQNPPGIPINPSIDQAVTNLAAHSGSQSFRESSSFTSGSFGDQVFSPSLTDEAGEPGAVDGGFSGGTLQPRFTATYWFHSVTTGAQDSHVVVSPDRGDGARMSWIQVSDNTTLPGDGRSGLSVSFFDYRVPPPGQCTNPGDTDTEGKCFVFTVLATNLSRSDWHRVDIEMEFYDGKANDVVRVSVDGGPAQRGTSWEDFFPNNQAFQFPTDPPTVDSLLFRVGGAAEGNAGEGFFFDDVNYASSACLAATRYVTTGGDDTFNDCRVVSEPCKTVQHAVDVACAGDTVQVGAGTFAEQVHIPKDLTVVGAGAGSTSIQAPASLPAAGDIVQIDGPSVAVDMSALTVAGPGPSGCGSINAGIHVMSGASADLHDLSVSDIRDQPLSGCQNGRAIRVGDPGSPATAVVRTSTIVNYQKNGLDVRDPASSLNAHDNTITGPGATTLIASNGVVVIGAQAAIVHNTISGNECNNVTCGPDPINDTQSTGVLLFPAGAGSTVSGNAISANDIGVYNTGTSTITGNQLTNNRFEGIVLDDGSATVSLNTVQGGNIGVAALSFGGNSGNSAGTLSCNHITLATQAGIELIDDNTADGVVPVVGGTSNSIKGNVAGFVNTTSNNQTFTGNWWGCVAGPNASGCDTVSGPVTTAPVATSVPACVSCSSSADCSDGLACNGSETCNAGSCQTGTPVVCFGDQCNNSACAEPTGTCVTTPKPNGTACSGAPDSCTLPDTCQSGTCVDGGGGDPDGDLICSADDNCPTVANPGQEDLDNDGIGNVCDGNDAAINLTQAKFKKSTGAEGNGSISLKGDFLTSGPGDALNTSAPIGIQVSDHLGTSQSFQWTTCVASGKRIKCKSTDAHHSSQASFKQLGVANQWKFVVKLKRRSIAGPFQGPVRATISHDTGIDRTDDISDCRATNSGLSCREF
jgi:parallel beta-helix repeat protein